MSPDLLRDFDRFAARLPDAPHMATLISEARYGLGLIAPLLRPGLRVLEVGAGAGILSGFLHVSGFDVMAVEPGAFDFMAALAEQVSSVTGFRALPIGATDLSDDLGTFDLIFSVHVLEHVQDLEAAFAAMASVLAPQGRMVHLCPNYAFPYEPHIGRFYLPWAKPDADVNFVTAARLCALARAHGFVARFDRGVMADFALRLRNDPVFAQRQRRLALAASLAPALRLVPPRLATPMIARFERPAA